MGLFTPFFRRERPALPLQPIDPEEQRVLDELRARREAARREQIEQANG